MNITISEQIEYNARHRREQFAKFFFEKIQENKKKTECKFCFTDNCFVYKSNGN